MQMHLNRYKWKAIGVAGFAFFLIKGLLWLTIPTLLWMYNAWSGS